MEAENEPILLPELLGPVFKTENITLRQALFDNNTSRKLRHLGTFVPDELIYSIENKTKIVNYEFAVLHLLDISCLYSMFDKFSNCQNNGSLGLLQTFNSCTSAIIEQIYSQGGDVLYISDSGILSMWKKSNKNEQPSKIIKRVVSCCLSVLETLETLDSEYFDMSKASIKSALSCGSVNFVMIGDGETRHYAVTGEPMIAVTEAVKLFQTNYLILTEAAWEHCASYDYIYVAEEKNHVKIIQELGKQRSVRFPKKRRNVTFICKPTIQGKIPECIAKKHHYYPEISKAMAAITNSTWKQRKCVAILRDCETEQKIINNRHRIIKSCKSPIGVTLKSFIIFPVLRQMELDLPLEYLSEMKKITVVMIKVTSEDYEENEDSEEIIDLADKCHSLILKACENVGCIESVSICNEVIEFRVVFGTRSYLYNFNHCRFGLLCAWKLLNTLKPLDNVSDVAIGVTTGILSCAVTGYVARRQYTFIGPSIIKAQNIMHIAHNKVLCDLTTLIYSKLKRRNFPASALIHTKECEKGYVFAYVDQDEAEEQIVSDLDDAYPILGRFVELELFSNILDDIGIVGRLHAGIIIEGGCRTGKSRLLDAFAVSAQSRQIVIMKVSLQPSFALKPYAVIHKIFEQILNTENCKTVIELERKIVKKLCHVVPAHDLCYLNKIMRVQFKLSNQYIIDTDWNRHHKTMMIFDKILKLYNKKVCVLLDDVHYMDYMSWIFFTHMLNNKNVVLALTILETQSWQVLSRVETDICKNKRLLRRGLSSLEREYIATLVCQYLEIQALSLELHDFLVNLEVKNPGWFEMFLNLMLAYQALDFVKVPTSEIDNYQLVFPDPLLSTRIPADLFPEETAPPEPLNKKKEIIVCFVNDNFDVAGSFIYYDIKSLTLEIFSKLNDYEQEIVKCASIIGRTFVRSILEMVIPDHQPAKTSAAIENLMQLRIFDCASLQRQLTRIGDLVINSLKPRSTFSDMHHLLRCYCQSGPNSPGDTNMSRCQFMEFKVTSFQHNIYDEIPEADKKVVHRHIVEIYKRVAKKCVACGGGFFLKIPGREKSHKPGSMMPRNTSNIKPPMEEMGTLSENDENRNSKKVKLSEISAMRDIDDYDFIDSENYSNEGRTNKRRTTWKLFKKTKVHPLMSDEIDLYSLRCKFGHNDNRNCRCLRVIDCIFRKLDQHLDYSDNYRRSINLSMEYAAALIQNGQPGYALRLLVTADRTHDFVSTYNAWKNPGLFKKIVKKSLILRLKGDAYVLLGNYPQAKSNYAEALSLYTINVSSHSLFLGSKLAYEKLRQRIRWKLMSHKYETNRKKEEKKKILFQQNAASCMSYISFVLMINNRLKASKLASVQSIALGFSNFEPKNFYNQCQLFLIFGKVYGQLGKLSFLRQVERYILFAIHKKSDWSNIEDIIMLMHVYTSIFKVSWLRGYLGRAIHFGERALGIAKVFHIIRVEYEIITSLIQTLIRLKRICETVDMLQQLRDFAFEDIDKSALTWYYALCMDLLLDAGLRVESYESCANYARKIIFGRPDHCIVRDLRGFKRLLAGLWSWQLRKGDLTSTIFVRSLHYFTEDLAVSDCSQIITLCKILECHLLLLTRCINMKKGSKMEMLLVDIKTLMDILDDIVKTVEFIKPHYFLLKAYFSLIYSRTSLMESYLRQAENTAHDHMNVMTLAWIIRNKSAWEALSYHNMARYWEENIGYWNTIAWQDVDTFDLIDWSNVLYSLPIPDSFI